MKIKPHQLQKKYLDDSLVLSVTGMSNVGKSFWSKRLRELGFTFFSCDDWIEANLAEELVKIGYGGIEDMARWLGQPYDKQYQQTQQAYLEWEEQSLYHVFAHIAENGGNWVIDTTGSMVHLPVISQEKLKANSVVVCLDAGEDMVDQMYEKFLSYPKPVVWADLFEHVKGEKYRDSLRRSYPKLLRYRSQKYREIADVLIPRDRIPFDSSVEEFFELLKENL